MAAPLTDTKLGLDWFETASSLAETGQTQFVAPDDCNPVTMIGASLLTQEPKPFRPIAVFKKRYPEQAAREQLNARISELAGLHTVPAYKAVTDLMINGKKVSGGLEQFVPLVPEPEYLEKATPELRQLLQKLCDERGALSLLRANKMAVKGSHDRKIIFTAIEQESIENLYIFEHLTLQGDMKTRNLMLQLSPRGALKLLAIDTEASFAENYKEYPLILAFPHMKRKFSAQKLEQISQWKLADFQALVDQNKGLTEKDKKQFVERFQSLQIAAQTMLDKAIIEIAYDNIEQFRQDWIDMRCEGFFTSFGVEFDASTYDSIYKK